MRFQVLLGAVTLSAGLGGPVGAAGAIGPEDSVLAERIAPHSQALVAQTSTARVEPLLDALDAVAADATLSPLERDAALFDYLQRLRAMPRHRVPAEAVDWLADYPAQAWRLHEESSTAQQPAFPINAAAEGLKHQWRFQAGRESAIASTGTDPAGLLEAYRSMTDGPTRAGIESALTTLPSDRLDRLAGAIDSHAPDLAVSTLNAKVRLLAGDVDGIIRVLNQAPPAVTATLLREIDRYLSADQVLLVARLALDHPDPGTHGLAMAAAGRVLAAQPSLSGEWQAHWLALLGQPETGSAAALQLARVLDGAQVESLAEVAGDDPLLVNRIELIRRLQQARLAQPEVQP